VGQPVELARDAASDRNPYVVTVEFGVYEICAASPGKIDARNDERWGKGAKYFATGATAEW
jgi:hypothetical protein